MTDQPDETCRTVDVDGEPVSVRGAGPLGAEGEAARFDVVRAARAVFDLRTIRRALEHLPAECRYHGIDLDRTGRAGPACCDTGRPSLARRDAIEALERLTAGESR